MRNFFLTALCLCGITSFAQTGFFLQPVIGGGVSNTIWQPAQTTLYNAYQKSTFSDALSMEAGYQNKHWEITTGLGYLNTGYRVKTNGSTFLPGVSDEYPAPHAWPQPILFGNFSMHDPHLILPLKVGYKIHLNQKLVFTPTIGVAAMYNLQRHIATKTFPGSGEEPTEDFNTYCNRFGLLGIAAFNFEYALNHKIILTAGPSFQYMLTSEMKNIDDNSYGQQYDYALLMNLGFKYCFSRKHTDKVTTTEELKPVTPQTN